MSEEKKQEGSGSLTLPEAAPLEKLQEGLRLAKLLCIENDGDFGQHNAADHADVCAICRITVTLEQAPTVKPKAEPSSETKP